MKPNHLHFALMSPDRPSLVLVDSHREARHLFLSYLNEAFRLEKSGISAFHAQLMFRFLEGGTLRFGPLADEYEIFRYRGTEWQNVFIDGLTDRALGLLAVNHLFKPVYKGGQNAI